MSEVKGTKPRTGSLGFETQVVDQRGGALIEFVLVLPLFLILIFGSFAVWKVVSAKQSLASGTYQAARYLSVEGEFLDYPGRPTPTPGSWRHAAWVIIDRELKNNSLLDDSPPEPIITFETKSSSKPQCPTEDALKAPMPDLELALFTVIAEITLPQPVRIPFLDPETITLEEKRTSYIECEPIFGPPPTPTPSPTPTPAL